MPQQQPLIRFSIEQLNSLPWTDAADYVEDFLFKTNNLSICSPDFVELHIQSDMNLLVDRANRAAKVLSQNAHLLHDNSNNRSSTSNGIDLEEVARALEQFLILMRHSFEASQGKIAFAFEADNFSLFKTLRLIFTECLLKTVQQENGVVVPVIPLWISSAANTCNGNNITLSRGTAARRAGFELLQTLAELPAFKDIIAENLFISLFHFISLAPVGLEEPHEDDFASRRLCAQVITSAIRSSKKVKSYVINHRLLEKIVPLLRDTPTGDFFLQVQTFEIIYRVTRQGPHVIDSLNLPQVIENPIRQANNPHHHHHHHNSNSNNSNSNHNHHSNPLGDSENFVINLMKILDLYNSQRVNNYNSNGQQQAFEKGCPIYSFTVDSYDIAVEEASSTVTAPQPPNRNSSSTTTNNSSKIPLCKMAQQTQVLFSPRMCCLLIPGMNGLNHTFTLRQLSTFRISREHNLLITFKRVDKTFMKLFYGFSDSVVSDFDEFENIVARCCNGSQPQLQVAFNLALEPQVGSDLRQSPIQGWVKNSFDMKKKHIIVIPQPQQVVTNNNTAVGFGSSRDPNAIIPQQQQGNNNNFLTLFQKPAPQQPQQNVGGSGAPPSLTNMFGSFTNQQQQQQQQQSTAFPSMVRLSVSMPSSHHHQQDQQQQQFGNNNIFETINNNHNGNSNGGYGFSNISVSSMLMNQQQQPQQQMMNNNNNNLLRGRSTSQTNGGASSILAQQLDSKLQQMAREKSSRARQASMELLQQAMTAIQMRRNEVEQQNRQDRENFHNFVRTEVQALRNAAVMAKDRAASEGSALNSELKQLEEQSRMVQQDAKRMRDLVDALASTTTVDQHEDAAFNNNNVRGTQQQVQTMFHEKFTRITKDIEAALFECYEKIDQINAQSCLPEQFVRNFFPQQ